MMRGTFSPPNKLRSPPVPVPCSGCGANTIHSEPARYSFCHANVDSIAADDFPGIGQLYLGNAEETVRSTTAL